MKLTNLYGIPEAFQRFEEAHPYDPGPANISVTSLIDSPQIRRLRREHAEDISEDVSDRIYAILGTAVHAILEDGAAPDQIVEERLFAEFSGQMISGQIDLQTPRKNGDRVLSDYKTASAATVQFNPEGKDAWVKQLNCYAAIARANGIGVQGLEVVAVLRDWTKSRASRSVAYPQHPVVTIPIEMWTTHKCVDFINRRLSLHADDAAECTPEDRWSRGGKVKAFEHNLDGTLRKRATRVFPTMTDAQMWSLSQSKDIELIAEDTTFTRCEQYCAVAPFCTQHYTQETK